MMNNKENWIQINPDTGSSVRKEKPIIKVMGVGGGGGNAAKHMYNMGITDVDFMICNTDHQALEDNPIPIKIQLGESGLGAGAIPEVARTAALESEAQIKTSLEGTKMLFITAGMGGGTGTGASPVIASIAREMGILTVAIVTKPFLFEQNDKLNIAEEGINELGQNVDALIVIQNEALRAYYSDLSFSNAFAKADDVLLTAAKSIAEIITVKAIVNVDFNDVKTILQNSGTAIIGSGEGAGETRAEDAIEMAISCPLLEKNLIAGASKMLVYLSYSREHEMTIAEMTTIMDILYEESGNMKKKFIWGHGFDDTLGEQVRVTLIATCLNQEQRRSAAVVSKKPQPQPQSPITPVVSPQKPSKDWFDDNKSTNQVSNEEINGMSDSKLESYFKETVNKKRIQIQPAQEEVSDSYANQNGLQKPIYLDVID